MSLAADIVSRAVILSVSVFTNKLPQ